MNENSKQEEVKVVKSKKAAKVEAVAKIESVAVEQPVANIHKINNADLVQLFKDNGCKPYSKAKSDNVVYQQFGTKSRVLMYNSKKSPERSQLLLTEADYEEFKKWYNEQADDIKAMFESDSVKFPGMLSASEKPRVNSVKVNNVDGLTVFIKFMAGNLMNGLEYEMPVKTKKTKKEIVVQ